jgi:hypothetical protein
MAQATIAVAQDTYSHVLPDLQRDAAKPMDAVPTAGS